MFFFFALQMTADELQDIEVMEWLPLENVSNWLCVISGFSII